MLGFAVMLVLKIIAVLLIAATVSIRAMALHAISIVMPSTEFLFDVATDKVMVILTVVLLLEVNIVSNSWNSIAILKPLILLTLEWILLPMLIIPSRRLVFPRERRFLIEIMLSITTTIILHC